MKKFYFVILISVITFTANAQNLDWAASIGGATFDESRCVTADDVGNIYVTGRFEGTVDFDPGANTLNLSSNGGRDIFIQKLDASGSLLWAKSIGGPLRDDAYSITSDALGNVYITGRFEGTVDFDPGTANVLLTSNGNRDIYILKLDAAANFVWVKSMGELSNDRGYSIATDPTGNIYSTGYFAGTVDFDPGTGTSNLTSNGEDDVFIQKLDAGGNFIWAKSIGGLDYDEGWTITTDNSGNSYISGYYGGTVDFDPGAGTFNLTSNGSKDAFVLKLDVSGDFLWAKSIGGSAFDGGQSINVDASGNVYISGIFEDIVDFDPNPATFNLTSNGQFDIFILKLDVSGTFVWAKSVGGTTSDRAYSITSDVMGSTYITGSFEGTVDFDPGVGTSNSISNGQSDIFILKLDDSGEYSWDMAIGSATNDLAYSITVDANGNVYATGVFENTADFDPGSATVNLTSNGQSDIFVLKLSSTVGINSGLLSDTPTIFPNPTEGKLNIDLGKFRYVSVKVFNVHGQLIYHRESITTAIHELEIDTKAGLYFVELSSKSERLSYKFIKL